NPKSQIPNPRSQTFYLGFGVWGLLHSLPDDFVNRRYAFLHLPKAAAAQRDHSFVNRLAPQFERRGAHENQFAEILGDFHHFVQADTTLVAGVVALLAALALVRNHRLGIFGVDPGVHQSLGWRGMRFRAVLANAAHETLRADQVQRAGDEARLDAHVPQKVDSAGR